MLNVSRIVNGCDITQLERLQSAKLTCATCNITTSCCTYDAYIFFYRNLNVIKYTFLRIKVKKKALQEGYNMTILMETILWSLIVIFLLQDKKKKKLRNDCEDKRYIKERFCIQSLIKSRHKINGNRMYPYRIGNFDY